MIFGALVILLIALSLVFLIVPVLRKPSAKDSLGREQQNIVIAKEKKALLESQLAEGQMTQEDYDSAFSDLEASLALDLERQQALGTNQEAGKWAVWVFAAMVPALSIFIYLQLGEYKVIDNPSLAAPRSESAQAMSSGKAPSMSEMIQKVKDHLRDNPDDERGWFMLGRSLMTLQQFPEAVTALQRSYDLNKSDPNVMLALADALAMSNDGVMTGEPEQLVLQALELSPNELTGLWLAGLAAEQGGRLRESFDYFVKLLPMLKSDPQSESELKIMLAELKARQPDLPDLPGDNSTAQSVPTIASASVNSSNNESTGPSTITVSVTLDESLMSQVQPDNLVFIYAKAASGPPMPLAAKRLKVSDLPIQVTLSDSDAVMDQMKLSGFEQIKIGARVSKSGDPVAKPGDYFDETGAITRSSINGIVEINIYQVN
ncbi:MAG: c-type cytochrome biogenesis protein CcmI [Gammaproteobacteria bacterium]|jgi:cytochrome c-type biogenesis protein CcmH|nr:c-type cytochrome biogenesis protein CcmI [Gammaproteobacteria bacterium]MBT4077992.1 c-type cytochrome biogenesis protein CcmI [Gammaproteobacteria bacterium]MBT4194920.1 c-type cytochrome biogenesis protein CcmI [Gammaproteobacteria bacterium]MBT4450742.1 c-type cytochrome biogenesis protein CcmI [Gammaproteobacteria bacterium]MBT6703482.1 c-type cytochrome biogenesis protein CcmI [Gammaproteobacteria bacterium]